MKIDFDYYTHIVDNLVGYILHQLLGILYAANLAGIVNANIDCATLSIGETAYPFKIVVFPDLLIFYVLGFHVSITLKTKFHCVTDEMESAFCEERSLIQSI